MQPEGHDTYATIEAASLRSASASVPHALVHRLGILSIAPWIEMHQPVSSRQLDDLRFETSSAPGSPNNRRTRAGQLGICQSYSEAAAAHRIAELAGKPSGTPTLKRWLDSAFRGTAGLPGSCERLGFKVRTSARAECGAANQAAARLNEDKCRETAPAGHDLDRSMGEGRPVWFDVSGYRG
jgi:hypothetical protein